MGDVQFSLKLVIVCSALCTCCAYGSEMPPKPGLPISIPSREGCISSGAGSASYVNAFRATVSLTSLMIPQRDWRAYDRADKALRRHNFKDARKQLEKAISADQNSPVAWCLMGILHEEQLQLDNAATDYSQALSLDSRVLPAYLGLARIAFRRHEWRAVTKITDQLARIDPIAFPVGYLYNAAAHFNLGELAAAESSARRFQSLDKAHERPQVHLLLGDILARECDFRDAAEEKRLFLSIMPNADDANDIRSQIRALDDPGNANKDDEFIKPAN
jgi:tetratricopeptide (TPR) repeat protein